MAPLGRSFAVRFTVPLLVAGMLAAAAPTVTLAAADHSTTAAALGAERYLSSYGDPQAVAASTDDAALAAERYLSSYGNPDTLAPGAVEGVSTSGPSWMAAILASLGLAIGAGLAGIAGGRATKRLSA